MLEQKKKEVSNLHFISSSSSVVWRHNRDRREKNSSIVDGRQCDDQKTHHEILLLRVGHPPHSSAKHTTILPDTRNGKRAREKKPKVTLTSFQFNAEPRALAHITLISCVTTFSAAQQYVQHGTAPTVLKWRKFAQNEKSLYMYLNTIYNSEVDGVLFRVRDIHKAINVRPADDHKARLIWNRVGSWIRLEKVCQAWMRVNFTAPNRPFSSLKSIWVVFVVAQFATPSTSDADDPLRTIVPQFLRCSGPHGY